MSEYKIEALVTYYITHTIEADSEDEAVGILELTRKLALVDDADNFSLADLSIGKVTLLTR